MNNLTIPCITLSRREFTIQIYKENPTVYDLKYAIQDQEDIKVSEMKIVWNATPLFENNQKLSILGIPDINNQRKVTVIYNNITLSYLAKGEFSKNNFNKLAKFINPIVYSAYYLNPSLLLRIFNFDKILKLQSWMRYIIFKIRNKKENLRQESVCAALTILAKVVVLNVSLWEYSSIRFSNIVSQRLFLEDEVNNNKVPLYGFTSSVQPTNSSKRTISDKDLCKRIDYKGISLSAAHRLAIVSPYEEFSESASTLRILRIANRIDVIAITSVLVIISKECNLITN